MASNPYELRWEVYTRAEDLLKERYEAEVLAYESRKEQGLETGKYPSFPSESLILLAKSTRLVICFFVRNSILIKLFILCVIE